MPDSHVSRYKTGLAPSPCPPMTPSFSCRPPAWPALLAVAFALPAAAQEREPLPLWELGGVALGVSQQAYPGSDRRVQRGLALPYLVYRGRFFRADNEGIGVRAIRTPRYEFDVSASGAFGSDADDDPARSGMPDLGTLVEFGPRLKWHLGGTPETGRWRLDLPLRGVFDLSDGLAYRGLVFQPGVSWSKRVAPRWTLGTSFSALVADRRLAGTFYDVEPQYARPGRPAYQAEAGLLGWRAGLSVLHHASRDWTLFGFARIDTVAGAANRASPLVRQTTGASVGIGVSYTWLRSSRPAQD